MKTFYLFLFFLLCSGADGFGVIGEKTEDFSEAETGSSLPSILKRENDRKSSKKTVRFTGLPDTIDEPKKRPKRKSAEEAISKTINKKLSTKETQEVNLSTSFLPAHITGHYWDLVKGSFSEESSPPGISPDSLSKERPKPRKLLSTRGKTIYFKRTELSASKRQLAFSQRTYSIHCLKSSDIHWGSSSNQ